MTARGARLPELNPATDWPGAIRSFAEAAVRKPATLVIGSGMSCVRDEKGRWASGVWDVPKILEHVEREHRLTEPSRASADAYGEVMRKLGVTKTAEDVAQVIRRAVLAACTLAPEHADVQSAQVTAADRGKPGCHKLVTQHIQEWRMPPAMSALARLLAWIVEQRESQRAPVPPLRVITTNFDELLEVALRRHQLGERFKSFNLVDDEFPRGAGESIHIWHVHGTWRDTMIHSPKDYTAARDDLEAAIRESCDGAKICVFGYGGWEDIVFGTLAGMLQRRRFKDAPEVWWSFYEQDPAAIAERYEGVFQRLSGIRAQLTVKYFSGIDLNIELPKLWPADDPTPPSSSGGTNPWSDQVVKLLGALVAQLDERVGAELSRLHAEAERRNPVNLCHVVLALCNVLSAMSGSRRIAFATQARDLLDVMSLELGARVKLSEDWRQLPHQPGKLLEVPVETPLLVEILTARGEGRSRLNLEPHAEGARNPRGTEARNLAFEAGSAPEDWIRNFESMLWRKLVRADVEYDVDRDRRMLHARLSVNALKKEREVVLLPASSAHYADVAKGLSAVTFIQLRGSGEARLDLNEFELAHLVSDFLKLCRDTADSPRN